MAPTLAARIALLIMATIFGLFFMALGVVGVALEYQTPPVHMMHLGAFLFSILLGSMLVPGVGALIMGRLVNVIALAGDARRATGFGRRSGEIDRPTSSTPPSTPPSIPPEAP